MGIVSDREHHVKNSINTVIKRYESLENANTSFEIKPQGGNGVSLRLELAKE